MLLLIALTGSFAVIGCLGFDNILSLLMLGMLYLTAAFSAVGSKMRSALAWNLSISSLIALSADVMTGTL